MLLSSRGYGLLWDNNSITRFGDPIPYDVASRDLKITGLDGKPGFTAKYYVGGQLKLTRTEKDIDYRFLKDLPNMPAELNGPDGKPLPDKKVVWEGTIDRRPGRGPGSSSIPATTPRSGSTASWSSTAGARTGTPGTTISTPP
jgi:hypothetical protein